MNDVISFWSYGIKPTEMLGGYWFLNRAGQKKTLKNIKS